MVFIDACLGKKTPYTPIWLMRQAGRYLHEYKAARAQAKDFLDFCANVDLATRVTLQPIEILDVDAAIIFSDILLICNAMGLELEFVKDVGPKFKTTIQTQNDVDKLKIGAYKDLDYVYDIVSNTRKNLSKDKALIGFSGAPWTLATYMIEGSGTKSYEKVKKVLYSSPKVLHSLLQKLSNEIKQYLLMQIKAGANAVMIFDSWANALECSKYLEFSWKYINDIVDFLKLQSPQTPIIAFPRGVGAFLEILDGNFEVLSIDWQIPMQIAKQKAGHKFILQGNLEPARLYDESSMLDGIKEIINTMQNHRHIFNLGHGMIKDLPRENAIKLIQLVREMSSKF